MKTFVLDSVLPEDKLAREVCEELGIDAEFTSEFSSILPYLEIGKVMVIDVARGIDRVQLVDVDKLKNIHTVTAHDFDFASELTLTLSAKLFPKENLILVGIPMGMEKEDAKKQLQEFLQDFDGKTI